MPTGINFDLRLWADGRGEAAERSAAKQRRRQPAARAIVDKLPRAAGQRIGWKYGDGSKQRLVDVARPVAVRADEVSDGLDRSSD